MKVNRSNKKKHYMPQVLIITLLLAVIILCINILSFNDNDDKNTSSDTTTSDVDTSSHDTSSDDTSSDGTSSDDTTSYDTTSGNTDADVNDTPWNLILTNKYNPLDANLQVTKKKVPNGLEVDERIYDDLMRMVNDAKKLDYTLVICSAYRSIEKQQSLFDAQVKKNKSLGLSDEEATAKAGTAVAIPGTSEHHTGLAVDIVPIHHQTLDESVEKTDEIQWLYANCYKYGFILRYPQDKSDITGIIYEPWHYRYVGVEAATEITQKGICLEEYLGKVN